MPLCSCDALYWQPEMTQSPSALHTSITIKRTQHGHCRSVQFKFFYLYFLCVCVTEILLLVSTVTFASRTLLFTAWILYVTFIELYYSGVEQYTYYTYSVYVSPSLSCLSWFLSIDAKRLRGLRGCTYWVFRRCLAAWKEARCWKSFRGLAGSSRLLFS